MKALFLHSHIFGVDADDSVYSPGRLPYSAWERYLTHFDELEVLARCRPRGAADTDLASGPRVKFTWLPAANHWRRYRAEQRETQRRVRDAVGRADAVIVRQCAQAWLAAAWARRLGKPWAVEVVGDAWEAYWHHGSPVARMYAPLAWWQARRWIRRADYALYVTRHRLQQRYPCDGVCSFASNVVIPPPPPSVWEARQMRLVHRPQETGPWVIGMIGSLTAAYKGLGVLLKALRRVSPDQRPLQLRVLGDGPMEVWRKSAEDCGLSRHVRWDGTLPAGKPVMKWLDAIDIYVQPSLTEGLPRALVEAMSRGLPALGSSAGGIPELLPPECQHRPGDDRQLARHLLRMLDDAEWRRLQAERNYREAQAYYQARVDAQRDAFWRQFAEFARSRTRCGL